jgi:hypothetical protein
MNKSPYVHIMNDAPAPALAFVRALQYALE